MTHWRSSPGSSQLLCAAALALLAGCSHMLPGGVHALAPNTIRQSAVRTLAAHRLEGQFGGVSANPTAQAELNRIGGQILAAARDCRVECYFRILRSSEVNAFSVPEGGIYVTAGLYNRLTTEELLAAALAHEIAHVATGDGRRPSRTKTEQLQKEMGADLRAARYLAIAGYDPRALLNLMEIIRHEQYPGWAATRIQAIEQQLSPAPPTEQWHASGS